MKASGFDLLNSSKVLITALGLSLALSLPAKELKAPIQITCGNIEQGPAVKFAINPLKKAIAYEIFTDGKSVGGAGFGPSYGIYDEAELVFSGGEFFTHPFTRITGHYAQILRINHYKSITVELAKDGEGNLKLAAFSDAYEISESYRSGFPGLKEQSHAELLHLSCSVEGD